MLDLMIDFDKSLFRAINTGMSNDLFDAVLPWLREGKLWAPLYLFLASFLWVNFKRRGLIVGLGLILSVGLADFTSGTLIKKNVQRVRPCNDPSMETMIIERVPCGSGYSFTSNHSANHFAIASFLIVLFGHTGRAFRYAAVLWAGSIAFSQVYVGVHYPLDVACGALLGILIGGLSGRWFSRHYPLSEAS
ncbi:MAG: phosphatase PAP2 family protein [Bacteroidota bacterium]